MKEKQEEDCLHLLYWKRRRNKIVYTCSDEKEEGRRLSIPALMKEKKEEDWLYLLWWKRRRKEIVYTCSNEREEGRRLSIRALINRLCPNLIFFKIFFWNFQFILEMFPEERKHGILKWPKSTAPELSKVCRFYY